MATPSPRMKKHEACYWINEILVGLRNGVKYANQAIEKIAAGDFTGCGSTSPDAMRTYQANSIEEAQKKIAALDIAASALTK